MRPVLSPIRVPILKFMILNTMNKYNAHFYGFGNGDVFFTTSLVKSLQTILSSNLYSKRPMLVIGQRTNVQNVTEEKASSFERIHELSKKGNIFSPWGEDYFITDSTYPWKGCPGIVIGRGGYDNYLVLNTRKQNHTTIDATKTLLALHQTTKAGNKENLMHLNSTYNINLLKHLYKGMNYAAGISSCTSYYTELNQRTKNIQILPRKVNEHCFPLA